MCESALCPNVHPVSVLYTKHSGECHVSRGGPVEVPRKCSLHGWRDFLPHGLFSQGFLDLSKFFTLCDCVVYLGESRLYRSFFTLITLVVETALVSFQKLPWRLPPPTISASFVHLIFDQTVWLNSPIFWQQSSWFWIQAQYFFSPLSSNDDSQVSTFADRYPCCTTLIKSGVSETLVFWIFTDFPGSLQYLILSSFSWGFHCLHPWYRFSVQYQLKKFSKTLPQLLPTPRLVASIVVCCHVHTPILRLLLVLRIQVTLKLFPLF